VSDFDTLHARASEDLIFALQHPQFVEYFELPETKAGNVFDENGVMQFTDNQRKIKQDLEQWIYHFQNKFDVDETCLIDTTGQEHARLVLSIIAPDEELSPEEKMTPFFEPSFMKQKNEVHVQYPYVSPDTGRWVFAYTSPVELGNGLKPAFYHFEMPLLVLEDLLHQEDGRMYILDPEGYVIADSYGLVSKTVIDSDPEKHFPPFQSVYAASSSDVLDEMKSNEIGFGAYTIGDEEHFFVYEKLSIFGWILVHDKPTSMILVGNDTITNLMITISLIATAVSVFGIFGVLLISTRISKPISKLAQQISSENPERLEKLKTPNHEIGQISSAVNVLLKKITKSQEEINLKNQELTIQKNQLKRLAKVGELTSRLTHNLRTPLTVIKMSIELLKEKSKDTLDDLSLKKLDRIYSSSLNIEKQIEDILTYVRDKPLELQNVQLDELIQSTLQNISVPQGIKIIYSKTNTHIHCDPDKLQIVFLNIISNAIDVLGTTGTINIDYSLSSNKNLIKISDDGPGIPTENLTKIFDSLFTTKATGTGLGLSYCKSVVTQHGGSIVVSTNPTTFTISLPQKTILRKSRK